MKYMLLIYHDEKSWDELADAEQLQIYGEYRELVQELESSGEYLAGDELQPTNTASSVRVRDGKHLMTDGPFAETREQLGGFFLIKVDSRERANEIAARIPSARTGSVEVRPVAEMTEAAQSLNH